MAQTVTILRIDGPFDVIENAEGSKVQKTVRKWITRFQTTTGTLYEATTCNDTGCAVHEHPVDPTTYDPAAAQKQMTKVIAARPATEGTTVIV